MARSTSVSLVLAVVGFVLTAAMDNTSLESTISTVIGWLYYAGMESSARQATLGKGLLGLRVTDLDGDRISFLRATGRHFAKILSALILFIGFIMVGLLVGPFGLGRLVFDHPWLAHFTITDPVLDLDLRYEKRSVRSGDALGDRPTGRTPGFGPGNRGSSPCPPALQRPRYLLLV